MLHKEVLTSHLIKSVEKTHKNYLCLLKSNKTNQNQNNNNNKNQNQNNNINKLIIIIVILLLVDVNQLLNHHYKN